MQAYVLGDVGVIWCNSFGDSLFQIYVMNFVEIVIDYYSYITSHVSQAFASCTHYTSYSLLNFVHVGKFRPQIKELTSFKPKLLIRFIMNKTC